MCRIKLVQHLLPHKNLLLPHLFLLKLAVDGGDVVRPPHVVKGGVDAELGLRGVGGLPRVGHGHRQHHLRAGGDLQPAGDRVVARAER